MRESYEKRLEALNVQICELRVEGEVAAGGMRELRESLRRCEEERCRQEAEAERQRSSAQTQLVEIGQLSGRIRSVEVLNERLEAERAQLFEQLHMLLQQNQEILTQTLANKDLYHEESKAYMQQLHALKRQKESLELKIMEQYRSGGAAAAAVPRQVAKSGSNLIDMVSKTTRQLVQKVRQGKQAAHSADVRDG